MTKKRNKKAKWSGIRQGFVLNDACPTSEGKYPDLKMRGRNGMKRLPQLLKVNVFLILGMSI